MKMLAMAVTMVAIAGCASTGGRKDEIAPEATALVVGNITLREKITPPRDSEIIVWLQDVPSGDSSPALRHEGRIPLNGRTMPVKFRLTPGLADLRDDLSYVVRAEMRSAEGKILWESDRDYPVDSAKPVQRVPTIVLVRVRQRPE